MSNIEDFVSRRVERAEQKRQDKQDAYKKVYKELMNIPVFSGRYDAKNADPKYMYGIESVMENIAYCAGGDELSDEFNTVFFDNMQYSQDHVSNNKNALLKYGLAVGSALAISGALCLFIKKLKGEK